MFAIVEVTCGNTNEGTSHHMITIPVTRKLYMFSLLYTNMKCELKIIQGYLNYVCANLDL